MADTKTDGAVSRHF